MADNRNTLTDEILVLAETLGDIKARFERVESEFAIQSRPLEAALAALSAAMTGIKTLQHHVLDNSLSALSLKVEEQRKAIDDQITVIVGELKGADAQNSEKIALQTAELKQQFAEICANVQQLSSQFDAQIKRVELEAKEQITKFAAVTGPQGPTGASFNPKGNWQEGVFYQRLDVVSLLGTSYVSNVDNNASKPTKNSDKWTVLAARAANVGGGGAGNFASLAGIAEVSQGGTGITQYAIGDILYANDTGSLARLPAGVNGQFLKTTGAGGAPEWETPTGGGDVVGPASATDNALVRFDGTSGTAIQNSNATLTDAGALTLASTINVTDTILGTSGPSVKSSLSARAPRQGLVFDGTSYATLGTAISAFGTGDFSVFAWVNSDLTVSVQGLLGSVNSPVGGFGLWTSSDGTLSVQFIGNTTIVGPSGVVTAGKATLVGYVRASGIGTFYSNGIAKGTVTDASNYSVGVSLIGAFGGSNIFKGTIAPYIENRALSASEVVALYEAGAPAGADFNVPGAGTAMITGDNSTFASDTGWWTLGGGAPATISGGRANFTNGSSYIQRNNFFTVGKKYVITVGSLSGTVVYNDGVVSLPLVAGQSVIATPTATYLQIFTASGGWIDDITVVPLGLLLAPDAAQAGGGLTWYDTSGNAANITLPASGVSWNVPSSRVLGGAWTVQGNLSVNANQILQTATSDTIYAYNQIRTSLSTGGGLFGVEGNAAGSLITGTNAYATVVSSTSSGTDLQFGTSGVVRATIGKTTGNLLIGTTTDSANGKLQLATHTTSAGGIGFGTDTALFRENTGQLTLSGANPRFNVSASTATNPALSQFVNSGGTVYCGADGSGAAFGAGAYTAIFGAGSQATAIISGGVKAAVFDTSQNATFAGTIAVQGTAARIYSGTGSPEGVVTAAAGSLYMNLSGGNNTTFYVKQSGSGNTGWNAK